MLWNLKVWNSNSKIFPPKFVIPQSYWVPEVGKCATYACKMLIPQDQLYHIIANLCLFREPHKSSINIINFYDSFFVQLFLKSTRCFHTSHEEWAGGSSMTNICKT